MDHKMEPGGPIFTAPFSVTLNTTLPYDLYCVTAPSNSRVAIREIRLGQFTEFGDAAAELLPLSLMTGCTSLSSGGAAITPVNRVGWPAGQDADVTALAASTSTLHSTASAERLHVGGFGMDSGQYCYEPCLPPVLNYSQRFHARFTAQSTEGVLGEMGMTLTFRELGRVPGH